MANADFRFGLSFLSQTKLAAQVLSFAGKAELNALYSFDITALIPTKDLNSLSREDILASPVRLSVTDASRKERTLKGKPQAFDASWHGTLSGFGVGGAVGDRSIVTLRMGPMLQALSGQVQNRIHLNSDSVDIVRDSLSFGGHPEGALSLKLDRSLYPKRGFVFQRDEDLLVFVLRQLEREGIALWFDQSGDSEELLLSDSMEGFQTLFLGDSPLAMRHAGISGLRPSAGEALLYGASAEARGLPKTLRLRDYNWRNPDLPLEVVTTVADHGQGELYLYGEGFESLSEGKRLASIIREGELSRATLYHGLATAPGLMPGSLFSLSGNGGNGGSGGAFLVVSASYEGKTGWSETGEPSQGDPPGLTVSLTFQSQGVPYRPKRRQPKPKAAGPVTAWIDGSGSGEKPELDGMGRYKVLLPLDVSGRNGGKASSWLRMAQPYVGKGYGQSFPLTPGAEVLLSFLDGNPDRPVIQGAVPNGETGSMVAGGNANQSGIGTKGGSSLIFRDDPETQALTFDCGSQRGTLAISANSPTSTSTQSDTSSSILSTGDWGLVAFDSSIDTSMEYLLSVDSGIISTVVTLCSVLMQAAETVDSAIEVGTDYEDEDDVPKMLGYTRKVLGGAKHLDVVCLILQKVRAALIVDDNKPFEAPKHDNLLRLGATPNGSSMEVRGKMTKFNYSLHKMIALSMINSCISIGTGVTDARFAIPKGQASDKEKFDDEQVAKEAKRKAKNPNDETAKEEWTWKDTAASWASSGGSSAGGAAAGLIGVIGTLVGNTKQTQGLLIDNIVSDTLVMAKGAATLSAKGQLVVESSPNRVADLMSHFGYEDKVPEFLIDPDNLEMPRVHLSTDFQSKEGIVLRSPLVRALAEEVVQDARKSVMFRAEKSMRFLTGKGNTVYHDDPATSLTPYFLKKLDSIRGERVNVDTENPESGILLKTSQSGAHISIQTLKSDSAISLSQAEGQGENNQGGGALILDSKGANLGLKQNPSLSLMRENGPKAILSRTDKCLLTIENGSVILKHSDGNGLSLKNADAILESSENAQIKAGNGYLECSGARITCSVSDARLNGQVITFA
ncbi:MAG: type VI secretion system tip protein VgrG [Deltaproteobacteria bacterium]|jgi:type VI secretion system VgrG family protein|nr:type VI secretion system tip protein VgrG [Deltaproteobacteria bacterium]